MYNHVVAGGGGSVGMPPRKLNLIKPKMPCLLQFLVSIILVVAMLAVQITCTLAHTAAIYERCLCLLKKF